jgi:hypothetical protein
MAAWRLLIGGSSCVGKTTVARELGTRLGLRVVQTDCSLPADPRLDPLAGGDEVWDGTPSDLCRRLVAAAEAAIPYVATQARALAAEPGGWIIEGERVHPRLIARLARRGAARGVVIVETDRGRLTETLTARLPSFASLGGSRRRTIVEVDGLYNEWLIGEACRQGVGRVDSQPWATLGDRVLAAARWPGAPPN